MTRPAKHFFQKPSFYASSEEAHRGEVSFESPVIHLFNFFFLARYFLRRIGSQLPPCGIKNLFYQLSGIQTGRRVFIGEGVYFVDGFMDDLIVLEEEAVISPKAVLVAMAVPYESSLKKRYRVCKTGKITIGRSAWLGAGCVILPGVAVGEGAIIGANAVVTENVPSYEVWGGNPARFIKRVEEYGEIVHA